MLSASAAVASVQPRHQVAHRLVPLRGSGRSVPGNYHPWIYWVRGNVSSYGNIGPSAVADCTVATAADLEQIFDGKTNPFPTSPWVSAYAALLAAEQPGTAPGPNAGLYINDVLTAWSTTGIAGTRIQAARPISLAKASVERALDRGPLYASFALPAPINDDAVTVNSDYVAATPWTPTFAGAGYAAGGVHAAAVVGFDSTYVYVESWGYVQPVTWAWWSEFSTAAWAIAP